MAKKKDDIPDWVTDEIQNAKFKKPKELRISGYVLEKSFRIFRKRKRDRNECNLSI